MLNRKPPEKISPPLRKRVEIAISAANTGDDPISVLIKFNTKPGKDQSIAALNERLLGGRGRLLPIIGVVAAALNGRELSQLCSCEEVCQIWADEIMHPVEVSQKVRSSIDPPRH